MKIKITILCLMLLSGIAFAEETGVLPSWVTNLTMKGDLRLRQHTDWDSSLNYSRSRQRMRLRIGFDTKASENIKASFGLATGSEKVSGTSVVDSDPTSTNHTFSNGFGKAIVMVDYAYMEYSPYVWAKITAGKMKSGTQVWQATDLKWDTDINPDGFAVALNRSVNQFELFLNGSWLIFNELNSSQNNPDSYIVQPGANVKINDRYSIKAAVAFENLNVNGKNTGHYGTPAFDYICVNPSVELTVRSILNRYNLSVFTDMVNNTDSKPVGDKNAVAYGMKFGDEKILRCGDWQVNVLNKSVEANSWLNKLGDSDYFGGAANMSGNILKLSCGLTQSTLFNAAYYLGDVIKGASSTTAKSLLILDIVYKY
ncbi:MAG: putative porin [Elusimicrobiota bacterium]